MLTIIVVRLSGSTDAFLHVTADFAYQDQTIRYLFVYHYQADSWQYFKSRGYHEAAAAVFAEVIEKLDNYEHVKNVLENRSNALKMI